MNFFVSHETCLVTGWLPDPDENKKRHSGVIIEDLLPGIDLKRNHKHSTKNAGTLVQWRCYLYRMRSTIIRPLIKKEKLLVIIIGQSLLIMPYQIQHPRPAISNNKNTREMSSAFRDLMSLISCGRSDDEVRTPATIPIHSMPIRLRAKVKIDASQGRLLVATEFFDVITTNALFHKTIEIECKTSGSADCEENEQRAGSMIIH